MPSRLRRYDEYGHIHFLTISCYRRLLFFRHDPVKRVFVDGMALGSGEKPFWKAWAYDFNVTTEKTLRTKLDYIHKNPITRGLVERAEQWVWSSYRYYEYDDDSIIAMDRDGSWPMV
ncbi:MAG: hypothetical protein IIB60_02615 [Planctomycetes bacterium]|nr:hypothetical protein [Planctomycetota bacterium]